MYCDFPFSEVVFNEHVPTSREVFEKRKTRAFEELTNSVSNIVTKMFGPGIKDGLQLLLEILQNPHFNKQVS